MPDLQPDFYQTKKIQGKISTTTTTSILYPPKTNPSTYINNYSYESKLYIFGLTNGHFALLDCCTLNVLTKISRGPFQPFAHGALFSRSCIKHKKWSRSTKSTAHVAQNMPGIHAPLHEQQNWNRYAKGTGVRGWLAAQCPPPHCIPAWFLTPAPGRILHSQLGATRALQRGPPPSAGSVDLYVICIVHLVQLQ